MAVIIGNQMQKEFLHGFNLRRAGFYLVCRKQVLELFISTKDQLAILVILSLYELFSLSIDQQSPKRLISGTCNSCNMGMRDLPDMYA